MTHSADPTSLLRALVVDDESLARTRLRTLLNDCASPWASVQAEASSAAQALEMLQTQHFNVALVDIKMPGVDGMALVRSLQTMGPAPAVIFVTAHAEHAVHAFELEAVDYLTKPVRLERLQLALKKAERYLLAQVDTGANPKQEDVLVIHERGRTERVPLHQVIYFKAELKYVTVRTAQRSYIIEDTLSDLEQKFPGQFVRTHRNALVACRAVLALKKHYDAEDGEGWAVELHGVDELISVSRRQLATVKELLSR